MLITSIMQSMEVNILRTILLSQVMNLDAKTRELSAERAARRISKMLKKARIPLLSIKNKARATKHIKELREDGITMLGPVLSAKQVKDIRNFVANKDAYAGHVWSYSDRVAKPKDDIKKINHQACYILDDIVAAPHLVELAHDPFILGIAQEYLGCIPTLYQMNMMHSLHEYKGDLGVAQNFHRDVDNLKFCVLFVYLTDVDAKSGPHQFIRKTHTAAGMKQTVEHYNKNNKNAKRRGTVSEDVFFDKDGKYGHHHCKKVFGSLIEQVEAPAGYAFLADVFGLHRGLPPTDSDRTLYWARYGLYDNGFSADITSHLIPKERIVNRIPTNRTYDYINRAMFESQLNAGSGVGTIHSAIFENFDTASDLLVAKFGKAPFIEKAFKLPFQKAKTKR